jgi:hypothetical protein
MGMPMDVSPGTSLVTDPSASVAIRWVPVVAIAAVLIVLAGVAARWGFGHAMLEQPAGRLERAVRGGFGFDQSSLDAGLLSIRRSLVLFPSAEGHDLAGLYQLFRYSHGMVNPQALIEAKAHFKASLQARPAMPYVWANLAKTKYLLGEVDTELFHALTAASRLGPWEPEVQQVVADLGLALWAELPGSSKEAVSAMLQRGLVQQPEQMVKLAQNRGRVDEICGLWHQRKPLSGCPANS